jgi:hypothetical protein
MEDIMVITNLTSRTLDISSVNFEPELRLALPAGQSRTIDDKYRTIGAIESAVITGWLSIVAFDDTDSSALTQAEFNTAVKYGECYVSASAATSVTSSTPIKVAGTTTAGDLDDFTMPADNRLRYDNADITRRFLVRCSGNVSSASAGEEATFQLRKNGAALVKSNVNVVIPAASDPGAFCTMAIVELTETDYVELWMDASASADYTVEDMILIVSPL